MARYLNFVFNKDAQSTSKVGFSNFDSEIPSLKGLAQMEQMAEAGKLVHGKAYACWAIFTETSDDSAEAFAVKDEDGNDIDVAPAATDDDIPF